VPVPVLIGKSRARAETALVKAGLRPSIHLVRTASMPAGTVIAESPNSRVRRGGTVRLDVAARAAAHAPAKAQRPAPAASPPKGAATTTQAAATTTTATPAPAPASASVPDLAGDVKAAVQQLAGRGLLASIQYVPGRATLGTVTAQSPQPSGTSGTGAHVTLSVSSGPGDKQRESVPDVVGKRVPDALQALNGAGLRLILLKRTVSDRSEAGSIVEQTPRPGASAPANAQVLVYMGAYRAH
jgi:serine/threonine-protein kinase